MNTKIALWMSWALFVGFIGHMAYAQVRGPEMITGCMVVSAAPTLVAGTSYPLTCSTTGLLRTAGTP